MAHYNRYNTTNTTKKPTKLLSSRSNRENGEEYEEKADIKPIQWASFYDRQECYGYPGEPIVAPTTYATARAATIAFLQSLKGGLRFIVHKNRSGERTEILASDLETEAFPVSEQMVDEYHGVTIYKDGAYLHEVYLFPLNSYLWGNTRRFWEKEDEEDEHDPRDDYDYDRSCYEDYDDTIGRYDDTDEEWNCRCGSSGPAFCDCHLRDDDN